MNEYLRLAKNANNQQKSRIKSLFENKNKTLTNSIAKLQRKLDDYQTRLALLDRPTAASAGANSSGGAGSTALAHKPRHVLKDVGQGLK